MGLKSLYLKESQSSCQGTPYSSLLTDELGVWQRPRMGTGVNFSELGMPEREAGRGRNTYALRLALFSKNIMAVT